MKSELKECNNFFLVQLANQTLYQQNRNHMIKFLKNSLLKLVHHAIRSFAMNLLIRMSSVSVIIFYTLGIPTNTFSSPLQEKLSEKVVTLNLRQFEGLEIKRFTSEQIQSLTPQMIQSISPEQIRTLKKSHINALAQDKSCASLRHLSQEQTQALGKNLKGLITLSPQEQLKALSPEQYQWISPAKRQLLPALIHQFYRHRIGSKSLDWKLSPEEIRQITPERLNGENFEMRDLFINISHFSHEQIKAIPSFYMLVFWSFPLLSPHQITALTSNQINYLTAQQFNLFSKDQAQALTYEQRSLINLNLKQARLLSHTFVQALFPEITLKQIQNMSAAQIAQLGNLNSEQGNLRMKLVMVFFSYLNHEQLRAIPPTQMSLLGPQDVESIQEEQIIHLSPEQIKNIYPTTFGTLKPSLIAAFREDQIHAIQADQMRFLSYNPENIAAISAHHVPHFSKEMIQEMNTHRLADFFIPSIIQHLLPHQIHVLDSRQIKALCYHADRADALKKHLNILTEEQKKNLDWNTVEAISRKKPLKWVLKPSALSSSR